MAEEERNAAGRALDAIAQLLGDLVRAEINMQNARESGDSAAIERAQADVQRLLALAKYPGMPVAR